MTQALIALSAARRRLVLDHAFFGVLALRLRLVQDDKIETCATDGTSLFFNSGFVVGLSPHELAGVVAHEVLHCADGHFWRCEDREPEKWNVACDYAINHIVTKAGMVLPQGALDDPMYHGMSAEAIYSALPNDFVSGSSGGGKSPGASCGQVITSAVAEKASTKAEWTAAVVAAAKVAELAGNLPAGLERLVRQAKTPPQDWRALLRRFIQQLDAADYSWRQPSPRYLHLGLYVPSLVKQDDMPPIVVVIDTSGSVSEDLLSQMESELRQLVSESSPQTVYVLCVDWEIQSVSVFERGEVVELHAVGGGGTNFSPAFEWVESQGIEPAALVYMTDLAGRFPSEAPPYPVLWADVFGRFSPPWGEHLRIH
jgi:predicted metal-dependent peptidase